MQVKMQLEISKTKKMSSNYTMFEKKKQMVREYKAKSPG